ncbi:hypothetical protein CPB85DRAFT_1310871 [Mucidula mucida]|nr:hypothetical protein CPB85DRAFT_1310871 [Mucidula mucida]
MAEVHSRWPSSKIYVSGYGFTEPNEGDLTDLFRIKEDVARTSKSWNTCLRIFRLIRSTPLLYASQECGNLRTPLSLMSAFLLHGAIMLSCR